MVTVRKALSTSPLRTRCPHYLRLIPYTSQSQKELDAAAPTSADPRPCREDGLNVGICVGTSYLLDGSRGFSDPSGDFLCRECRQCR